MAPDSAGSNGRRGIVGAAAVMASLLMAGVAVLGLGLGREPIPSPAPNAAPSPTRSAQAAPTSAALGDFLDASRPTRLEIPAIGLASSDFVSLRVQADGVITVPGAADEVGLYDGGPTPGQLGPSVLAAHVDTPSGRKGIFWDLGAVKPGQQVIVSRADGRRVRFAVDRVQAFKKSEFPTDLVYHGDFARAEIRLVTCGGPTDNRNEYRDNVVVFGHLTKVS
ncbi:MAG: sortase [Micrococcales bacterium]|nr:sortase [Micrococcales bacterium]